MPTFIIGPSPICDPRHCGMWAAAGPPPAAAAVSVPLRQGPHPGPAVADRPVSAVELLRILGQGSEAVEERQRADVADAIRCGGRKEAAARPTAWNDWDWGLTRAHVLTSGSSRSDGARGALRLWWPQQGDLRIA